jgi:hypothetical protein
MGKIHAHGRFFHEHGEETRGIALEELGVDAQGMHAGMTAAEHPLVAPDMADTVPDLVGELLEAELIIAHGQRTAQRIIHTPHSNLFSEMLNAFRETTIEDVIETEEGQRPRRTRKNIGQMKPMQGIKKKERPDPFVKIRAPTPMRVKGFASL